MIQVRPWKENNKWYATISADAYNSTVPCTGGGALFLYSSPSLHGEKMIWTHDGVMFASNYTVLTPFNPIIVQSNEFTTDVLIILVIF